MTLRGALIGCGFFARNHLHAWRDIEGAEIVALCDTDTTRLSETADHFGIASIYTDAAEMLARESLDFVDIATTPPSHRSLTELAAGAAVHVICQKPIAPTMKDAEAMVLVLKKARKLLMVHENFRWQTPIRTAIDIVARGDIGVPFFGRISFRSGYDVFSGQPYLATGERFIVEDLGIHILDISRALFGNVSRLGATMRRVNPAIRGEDVATMLLEHQDGATSVVDCSYATRRQPETFPESLLEIDGDAGTLRLDPGYRLTVQTRDRSEVHDVSPAMLPWASAPWHNIQESVRTIQAHFVDCIAKGAEPETSGRDNLHTFALVEAAYASAKSGEMVRLAG